jgi:hypothetical protein
MKSTYYLCDHLRPMKRTRNLIGITLLGVFLTYFSASFIFVPEAVPLRDVDTSIVKLENNDGNFAEGMFRSAEHAEEEVKFVGDYTISCLADFHTVLQQSKLESLQKSRFYTHDRYLSLRRLQI